MQFCISISLFIHFFCLQFVNNAIHTLDLLASFHSSTSFAFWAATACAAWETPGTVCDWRNVILELFVVAEAVELALFNSGLFGGIGGGCLTPIWFFFRGGVGWIAWPFGVTLWARMIVATFVPDVIELALSCRIIWPGEIGERAIPVAENWRNMLISMQIMRVDRYFSRKNSLGPETGTDEIVDVGWMTFATLLIIELAPLPSAAFLSDSFSIRRRVISSSRSLTLQEKWLLVSNCKF